MDLISNPTQTPPTSCDSIADLIALFLKNQGVTRVYGLCGGHIMPIWMRLDAHGIRIVDTRDERAAVYMAHAEAELTGRPGVALVTAGPGVTNAITGIANAHVARAPVVVISGTPPMAQEHRGGLQDMSHIPLVQSITRFARTVRHPDLVLSHLYEAMACAVGQGGESGPVFIDFPVDVLRSQPSPAVLLPEHFKPVRLPRLSADEADVRAAVDVLWQAKRPLFISGRGARGSSAALQQLLATLGAVYLDTGESRGLVPDSHDSVVAAMRGQVMQSADVVVTLGRKLDFQLAFGSPAVLGPAKFIRLSDNAAELRDNRRADVELLGDVNLSLQALLKWGAQKTPATDRAWSAGLRQKHLQRVEKLQHSMQQEAPGSDGLMHPNRVLAALREALPTDSVVVADGGDFLSFARVGLSSPQYLDPGPLGCIGVGTPFGIAASLACPDKTVVVATGDGAFGFNAMEIDTAVRHKAPVLIVVANNGAWAIEVRDQQETHGKVVGTRLQFADHAAMAKAFGMHAQRVERAEDLPAAIDKALKNLPALLDVLVTPEAVSSDAKSGLAWVPDLQALSSWDDLERVWRKGDSSPTA
jgi:acetolactate synthase-1/2/3 large subunit